jgi:hypothetical protein
MARSSAIGTLIDDVVSIMGPPGGPSVLAEANATLVIIDDEG